MDKVGIFDKVTKVLKANGPEILTGAALVGLASTTYLVAKGAMEAARKLDHEERTTPPVPDESTLDRTVRKTKVVWKSYIPAALSFGSTAVAIGMLSRSHGRRTAAALTAYGLSDKAFRAYREHVIEHIGENEENKVKAKALESMANDVPPPASMIVLEDGKVRCCELLTKRYFSCSMETLRKAENRINQLINTEYYVTLDEFYDEIGLEHTSQSDILGWSSDRLLELEFQSTLSADGVPCLAFKYNYLKPV